MHHKVKIKQSINSYMLIREMGVLTFIYLLQKTGLGLVNTEYLHLHPWCLRTKAYNAVHLKLNVWKPNDEYSLKNNPSLDSRGRQSISDVKSSYCETDVFKRWNVSPSQCHLPVKAGSQHD